MTKKKTGILIAVAVVVIALVLLLTQVILPNNRYNAAEKLLQEGKYQEASEAFAALGGYKDAASRVAEPYLLQGEKLLAEGKFAEALEALGKVGDAAKTREAVQAAAEKLQAAGEDAQAVELLKLQDADKIVTA